eukprot:TRINITY_DN5328_c0_g1_i2.p6 TRINITY_DN5328_c0_g1~~TRINITY_DN5328_c0_g1_i2.p6  ORF type:complete len:168 (-),score=19.28 TRINITY_DN5328_c0_g1_i2:56-559(-)
MGHPRVMHEIARTRNQELFLLVVILTCFGVAWLVSFTGMSIAIGALLAGLIISGSEYSHQAASIVLPFRDIFTSFFFISVGMLVDVRFLLANFWLVLFLIVLAIVAKAALATAAPHVLCVDTCLLYTSDAADDMQCVDLGGRRIIKKKKKRKNRNEQQTEQEDKEKI